MRPLVSSKQSHQRSDTKYRRRSSLEVLEDRRVLAAVAFAEAIAFDGGIRRSQVVETADMDGDGDLDTVANSDNELLVFFNNGAGEFGDPLPSDNVLPGRIRSLSLGDFDGDGDVDAITGSAGDSNQDHSTVALFSNDGTGKLEFTSTLLTSVDDEFVDDIATSDLDSDGDIDVVAAGRGSSRVFYFENGGDGTFSSAAVITGDFLEPRAVHITDMDGDGDLDVVGSSSYDDTASHHVFWFENTDGQATFGQLPASIIDTGRAPRYMDSADLDRDGDMDLIVPLQLEDEIVLIENTDGFGTITTSVVLATGLTEVERILVGDVDGDSDDDIVATVDAGGAVIWLDNSDGLGTFTELGFVSENTPHASGLSLADLDSDGDLDAVTTSQFSSGVSVHDNVGNALFVTNEITRPNAFDPRHVLLTDVDGDGDLDLVGQSDTDFEIAWYENAGDGTFGEQRLIANFDFFPSSTIVWWDIDAADMDGDGDMDIVTSTPNLTDTLIWYENVDGKGDFSQEHSFNGTTAGGDPLRALELSVLDYDGDGDNDIVANQFVDEEGVALYENIDGQGTFDATILISIPGHANRGNGEQVLGDMDGDGDLDVLVADNNVDTTARIVWYENVAGVFNEAEVLVAQIDTAREVRLADMDNDGDLDVVAAVDLTSESDSVLEWYENTDGSGTFSETGTFIGEQFLVTELTIVDVDGDGDQDVVAPDLAEGFVDVFDNDGLGLSFQRYQANTESYEFQAMTRTIGVGDISGDGRIDIVAGRETDNAYVTYIAEASTSPFDLDSNGDVNGDDAVLLCQSIRASSDDLRFDLDGDGIVMGGDIVVMLRDGLSSSVGDSNFDGTFGTADLVLVFQASQYEDAIEGNSTWATGDWNCDGDFSTVDLVFVFQNGIYDSGAAPAMPKHNHDVAAAIDSTAEPIKTTIAHEQREVEADRIHGPAILDVVEVDQLFDQDDDPSGMSLGDDLEAIDII